MPAINRSVGRNVHIYDVNGPATVLGGPIPTNEETNANLYSMVDIICIFNDQYFLRGDCGTTIKRDDHPVLPGK